MMKQVVKKGLAVIGVAGVVGVAMWVEVPKPAWAQVNALARWDFNDDPNSPSTGGVADVAGTPSPDFPGTAYSSVQRCSAVSVSTPKGTGDCIVLNAGDEDHIAGDQGVDLFPGSGDSPYTGSRSIAAWVRVTSSGGASGDRAIVHIGHDHPDYNASCDADNEDECSGFHLFLSNGQPAFGNGQGTSGATISCTSSTYDLDSSTNYNTWYFVVGTYDHNLAEDDDTPPTKSTRLYVNGTKCADGNIFFPQTSRDSDARWSIGGFIDLSGNVEHGFFSGALDDIRVFDRVLGQNEIDTLYSNSGNGG